MATLKKTTVALSIVIIVIFMTSFGVPTSYGFIQGHHPLFIQGHSPIVLLVTDPNGFQVGCTAVPCTSISSPNFVDTIPASEGPATYNFSSNAITIANAIPGTYTVKYIGTGAITSTPFTITGTSCPETNGDSKNKGHQEPGCAPADPDDKPVTVTLLSGTVIGSHTGSVTFTFNHNSAIRKQVCHDHDTVSLGNTAPNSNVLNQDCD